ECLALAMDMTEKGEPARLIEETAQRFGQINVLVGNVGGNRRGQFDDRVSRRCTGIRLRIR
ncbi:MAG: hypothetical protein R3324_18995, partial [Halobacteriales archaeon]|nr:hypothetical protein [Halobacteriales archaeon]